MEISLASTYCNFSLGLEQNFSNIPPKIMYAASVTEEQFIYSVSPWLDGTLHPAGEEMETDSGGSPLSYAIFLAPNID